MDTSNPSKLLKLGYGILAAAVLVAPFFWIPSILFPLDHSKAILIVVLLAVVMCLLGMSFLKGSWIVRPRGLILYGGTAVLLSALLSALVSPTIYKSLIGQGFEPTTFLTILVMIGTAYAALSVVKRDKQAAGIMKAISISAIAVGVFQVLRLALPSIFANTYFVTPTASIIGSWFDFGLLMALALSLILASFSIRGSKKSPIQIAAFVICLIFLALVNASFIWYALIIVCIVLLIMSVKIGKHVHVQHVEGDHAAAHHDAAHKKSGLSKFFAKINIWASITILVSVVFIIIGSSIVNPVTSKYLGFNENDVSINRNAIRLPWQMSLQLVTPIVKDNPVFGPGPNRFTYEYLLKKPASVNLTPQYGIEFNSAYGFIPTVMLTQGIVGMLAWLLLLVAVVLLVIKALRLAPTSGPERRPVILSVATANIFLWVTLVIFMPTYPILFLAFVMLGVLVAITQDDIDISMSSVPKIANTALHAAAGVLIVLFVIAGLWSVKKFIGAVYFQSAVFALNEQKIDDSISKFNTALWYGDGYDIYYQALSQAYLLKARQRFGASEKPDAVGIEAIKKDLTDSVNTAKLAVAKDPTNYYNHITEARISAGLVALQVPNSRENAERAYKDALTLNPFSPSGFLELAQFEASMGNFKDAKAILLGSIQLKENFLEGYFYLSQIALAENDVKGAVEALSQDVKYAPENPFFYFELGRIAYVTKEYEASLQLLDKAVTLEPQYSDARYFAGLALSKLGKVKEAITQFEIILQLNPENAQVQAILKNLRSGRAPLTGISDGESSPELETQPAAPVDLITPADKTAN